MLTRALMLCVCVRTSVDLPRGLGSSRPCASNCSGCSARSPRSRPRSRRPRRCATPSTRACFIHRASSPRRRTLTWSSLLSSRRVRSRSSSRVHHPPRHVPSSMLVGRHACRMPCVCGFGPIILNTRNRSARARYVTLMVGTLYFCVEYVHLTLALDLIWQAAATRAPPIIARTRALACPLATPECPALRVAPTAMTQTCRRPRVRYSSSVYLCYRLILHSATLRQTARELEAERHRTGKSTRLARARLLPRPAPNTQYKLHT